MAEYQGSNSNATMGANLKEVYPKDKKKKKFSKIIKLMGGC